MGDRTSVALRVLTSQVERVKEIIKGEYYETDYNEPSLTIFNFDEVNYGTLPFLEALMDNGIAYDSKWDSGSEYGPGAESCRFTSEGEAVMKGFSDSAKNPDIHCLLQFIDQPERLRQFILDHITEREVLPWDNQEEYGKLHRMVQLIT